MEAIKKMPVVVYAESTPNPSAMKFVANKILLENSLPLEFFSAAEAKSSPLAMELFKFPFVKSVFISGNYITLFKIESVDWNEIIMELREFLRIYLSEGKAVMSEVGTKQDVNEKTIESKISSEVIDHTIPQTEIEKKIIDVLEQYVMPAVAQDGGLIVFRSYKDGVVSLLMRGACSGCPSSTVTLKAGIEALLKKFIPEVKEVVSESPTP
ncbi:MAG: NifU family protein [Bacteroidetes bacterium]|nr:NifU family protein [Bacteroidota bacterium]